MVVCKYFQQGNCRYGQYCRFEHVNNYGGTAALRGKTSYGDNKSVALAVAEEVLAAERGGQWLLSCFGPFKEQPSIPGMEDLSPEEYRWEMYQAQKNGTVDQTKLQYQQLCQDMKTKRNALKNPTQEIVAMLEKLQKGAQDTGFGTSNPLSKTTNFSFATPQLASTTSNASASSLFGSKSFTVPSNPFVGGSSSVFSPAGASTSLFGTSAGGNPSSAFGAKPAFGSNHIFGGATNSSALFGGGAKSSNSVFGAPAQNPPAFGAIAQQAGSAFSGANAQSVFGQPPAFGASVQVNSPFSRAQTAQPATSVFGGATTSTSSLFGSAAPTQVTASLFGAANTSSTSVFGAATSPQTTSSIFGGVTSSTSSLLGSPTSLFAQAKSGTAFGGAPVFGGAPNFGAKPGASIFGAQPTFGGAPAATNSIFGGAGTAAPTFGSIGQSTPATFGSIVKLPTSVFGSTQNAAPFGSAVSTTSAAPFGATVSTSSLPFGTASGPFAPANASSTPFGSGAPDNVAPFGTVTSASGTTFAGAANAASQFGSSPFGNVQDAPSFTATNTTVTTSTSNPFGQTLQQMNSPFGVPNQTSTSISSSQSGPFGKSPFASVFAKAEVVDDTIYTIEGQLTDDEKAMYLAEKFILGRIPLHPPTKELR